MCLIWKARMARDKPVTPDHCLINYLYGINNWKYFHVLTCNKTRFRSWKRHILLYSKFKIPI